MAFDTRTYCRENGIVSFSCGLKYNDDTKKKVPQIKGSWKKVTPENYLEYHDDGKSGFAIMMALNNIVVIDCDIDKAGGNFPQEILALLDNACEAIVKTPNGKHYYFKCAKDIKKQIDALWNGCKTPCLDIIAGLNFIFAPPTNYTRGDTIVAYQWIKGDLSTMAEMPDEIYQAIKPAAKNTIQYNTIEQPEQSDRYRDILNGLNAERFMSYDSWLKIGLILHNEKVENGLELWDEASKRAPDNYQINACADKWATFNYDCKQPATIATLYMWLRTDNPTLYNTLRKNSAYLEFLLTSGSHRDLAQMFYELNPDKYIYSPNGNIGWYVLQENNVWAYHGKAIDSYPTKLYNSLTPYLYDFIAKYKDMLEDNIDKNTHAEITLKLLALNKTLMTIKGAPFVSHIQYWLQSAYTKRDIYLDMDKNASLLAFTDCVYDFTICDFRPIKPEDYISTTCGYPAPTIESASIGMTPLKTFLNSLFEDNEMRNYLMKTLAYGLCGTNYLQEFYVWKGSGGNGKGALMSLLERAMGNYINTLPISYLVKGTVSKGAALPELAACKSARVVYSTEPDSSNREKLQNSVIKNLTGGDPQNVRGLFKDPTTYTPQFTLIIQANECAMNKVDAALERRLVVIEFPFAFKSAQHFNPQVEEHRLADRNLEAALQSNNVRDAFMLWLLEIWAAELYGNKEILRPAKVRASTTDFLNTSNPVTQWLYNNYDIVNDDSKRLTPTEFAADYNKDNIDRKLTPQTFSDYMALMGFHTIKKSGMRCFLNFEKKNIIL